MVIEPIVTALVLGAAAGAQDVAGKAIADAYDAVKGYLARRFPAVDLGVVEADPASEARRTVLREELERTHAVADPELARLARDLIEAVRATEPPCPPPWA